MNKANPTSVKQGWLSFRCRPGKEMMAIAYLSEHGDVIKEIKIYEENITKNKKETEQKKNFWPGNIFVKVDLEKGKIPQTTKQIIMKTPNFFRFNSYERSYYADPILFSDRHMQRLEEGTKNEQKLTTGKFKPEDIDFEINDLVSVLSGVFRGYEGEVTEIDYDTGIVTLNFEFFGRITPIKVGFLDCKKIS